MARRGSGAWVGLAALGALSAACEGRAPVEQDGAAPLEMRVIPDAGWKPDRARPDRGSSVSREYVISRLVLPTSSTATQIGHDYNHDGSVDNALGAILGGLSAMGGGSFQLQQSLDDVVNSGASLLLLRLVTASFVDDPGASVTVWHAEPQACCATAQSSSQCAAQARTTCFSGTHTFKVDPADPAGSLLSGMITGGAFDFGPGTLKLALTLLGSAPLELELKAVHLEGLLSGGEIVKGILAGALSQGEVSSTLVPALALMLDGRLQDPATDPQVRSVIKSLFDANGDGAISPDEVLNSSIVKTFMGGDVDVDSDGVKELSVGLGFEAARASILP